MWEFMLPMATLAGVQPSRFCPSELAPAGSFTYEWGDGHGPVVILGLFRGLETTDNCSCRFV